MNHDQPIETSISGVVPAARLFRVLAPEIDRARHEVSVALRGQRADPDAARLEGLALASLPVRALIRIVYRPLILELHEKRARNALQGESSAERFDDFTNALLDREYQEFFWHRYPAARREAVAALRRWAENVVALCTAFHRDRDAISRLFPDGSTCRPCELSMVAGDSHAGGQTVSVVTLEGGEKLVYKPRSGASERVFAAVVDRANELGFVPSLLPTRVSDHGTHSWVRATAPRPCEDEGEVRSFYRRLGGLVALSCVLSITDLHRENLIAFGEHPVVIDLETLQHSRLAMTEAAPPSRAEAIRVLAADSVLATGLVPTPQLFVRGERVLQSDVSGMSGDGTTPFVNEEPYFVDLDTDEMRVGVREVLVGGSHHAPTLHGAWQPPIAFEAEILDGFDRMYSLLLDNRAALAADDALQRALQEAPSRHITGATEMFSRLLWNSFHPSFLRDDHPRAAYLEKVLGRHAEVPNGAALAASEYSQLLNGDVPIFWSASGETALHSGDGTVVPGVLEPAQPHGFGERIARLSPADRQYQRSVISGALRSTLRHGTDAWSTPPRAAGRDLGTSSTNEDWALDEAKAIGAALLSMASWTNGQPQWLTWALHGNTFWMPQPAGDDLYAGRAGIALFLLRLGAAIDDRRFLEPAEALLTATTDELDRSLGFTGVLEGRILLADAWATATGDDAPLRAEITRAAPVLSERLGVDETFDIIGGAAGTLLMLSSVGTGRDGAGIGQLGREVLGAGLARLRAATQLSGDDGDVAWASPLRATEGMTGFSHGNAGIALALMRAQQVLEPGTIDPVAVSAVRWENSRYDERSSNWLDLRDGGGGNLIAWCHGAPGIALSRAESPAQYRVDETGRDVLRGVEAIGSAYEALRRANVLIDDLSLCHGALGNLMILDRLLDASSTETDRRGMRATLLADVRRSVVARGLSFGAPAGLVPSDLMTGLAGVGYGLLAAVDPAAAPDVLAFGASVDREAGGVSR